MKIVEPSATLLYSTPLSLITHAGRHSYQSHDKASEESDARLLAHFAKNDESPLEHSFAMFDVTCSYACHVHFLRHRHLSESWLSQRYTAGMGFVVPEALKANGYVYDSYNFGEQDYERQRRGGAKKQDARYVLPQGVAVRGSISGNARAFLNMLALRTSKKAMPETQHVALLMRTELGKVWPELFGEVSV